MYHLLCKLIALPNWSMVAYAGCVVQNAASHAVRLHVGPNINMLVSLGSHMHMQLMQHMEPHSKTPV